jgi:hypothetical protein
MLRVEERCTTKMPTNNARDLVEARRVGEVKSGRISARDRLMSPVSRKRS